MKWIALLMGLAFFSSAWAYKSYSSEHPVRAHGYEKKNGEHVDGYYRSKPHQHDNDPYHNKKNSNDD